jgi:hypothetical protein
MTNSNGPTPETDPVTEDLTEENLEIVYWIEATYHRRRRKAALGKLTPIEFERIQELAATAA